MYSVFQLAIRAVVCELEKTKFNRANMNFQVCCNLHVNSFLCTERIAMALYYPNVEDVSDSVCILSTDTQYHNKHAEAVKFNSAGYCICGDQLLDEQSQEAIVALACRETTT